VPSSPAVRGAGRHDAAAGCITLGNDGYDTHPAYSPDGLSIAYLSMATPGYEADTNRVKIYHLPTGARCVRTSLLRPQPTDDLGRRRRPHSGA